MRIACLKTRWVFLKAEDIYRQFRGESITIPHSTEETMKKIVLGFLFMTALAICTLAVIGAIGFGRVALKASATKSIAAADLKFEVPVVIGSEGVMAVRLPDQWLIETEDQLVQGGPDDVGTHRVLLTSKGASEMVFDGQINIEAPPSIIVAKHQPTTKH
ncbi:MAG: hypothetical protein WC750_05005 [Patescibacteria group bacterium]